MEHTLPLIAETCGLALTALLVLLTSDVRVAAINAIGIGCCVL